MGQKFGRELFAEMTQLKMSLAALSTATGAPIHILRQVVIGTQRPSEELAERIEEALRSVPLQNEPA